MSMIFKSFAFATSFVLVLANLSHGQTQSVVVSQASGAVCPKCGIVHGSQPATSVAQTSYTVTPSYTGTPSSTGNVAMSSPSSRGGVANVLSALNSQRSRSGLASLGSDPNLQAVAERRALQMASTGNKSHPPGSFSPGTHEGVGWSSSYAPSGVSACYTSDSRMRVAGAAMATGRDGVYFAVVYR